jgi:hypothetical protein
MNLYGRVQIPSTAVRWCSFKAPRLSTGPCAACIHYLDLESSPTERLQPNIFLSRSSHHQATMRSVMFPNLHILLYRNLQKSASQVDMVRHSHGKSASIEPVSHTSRNFVQYKLIILNLMFSLI